MFELVHRLWGGYAAGRPYDVSTKRRWGRLLELVETFAERDGYRRSF